MTGVLAGEPAPERGVATRATTLHVLRLLRARQRHSFGTGSRATSILLPLLVLGLSAVIGAALAPDDLGPTRTGAVVHSGGWLLESGFVGAVLAAMALGFRVLEILFRTDDAPALRLLPLDGAALAVDRAMRVGRDGLIASSLLLAFIAPGAVRAPEWVGAIALIWAAVAPLLAAAVSLGVILVLGVAALDGGRGLSRALGLPMAQSGAAIYHIAPGIAFAATCAVLLFAKLGAEEPLRQLREAGTVAFTPAAAVALGLPAAAAVVAAAAGLFGFAREHARVEARFAESESADLLVAGTFTAGAREVRSRFTRRWAGPLAALYFRGRVELARKSPLLRPGSVALALAIVAIDWAGRGRLSADGAGVLAGAWLAGLVTPHARLRPDRRRLIDLGATLASPPLLRDAASLAAARETALHLALLLPAAIAFPVPEWSGYVAPLIAAGGGLVLGDRLAARGGAFAPRLVAIACMLLPPLVLARLGPRAALVVGALPPAVAIGAILTIRTRPPASAQPEMRGAA